MDEPALIFHEKVPILRRRGRPKGSRDTRPRTRKLKLPDCAVTKKPTALVQDENEFCSESGDSGQTTSTSQFAMRPVMLRSSERMIDIFTACTCSSDDIKLELLSTAVDPESAWTTGATSPSILISSSLDPFHDDWPHWKRFAPSSLSSFSFPSDA